MEQLRHKVSKQIFLYCCTFQGESACMLRLSRPRKREITWLGKNAPTFARERHKFHYVHRESANPLPSLYKTHSIMQHLAFHQVSYSQATHTILDTRRLLKFKTPFCLSSCSLFVGYVIVRCRSFIVKHWEGMGPSTIPYQYITTSNSKLVGNEWKGQPYKKCNATSICNCELGPNQNIR